jgi:DNA repair protein RecN (Recombination protein N)
VTRLCTESYSTLYDSDAAVLASLGGVWRRVGELATLDPQFAPYMEAREGIKSQLEDLALFLRRYADGIESSPARLQQVEERLALLERLKRKYGPALADVIQARAALREQVRALDSLDEKLAELEGAHARARDHFLRSARRLSETRRAGAQTFARQLETALAELAMDRTQFEVRCAELPEQDWNREGIDQVEFFVSPNPGEEIRPLARIVSGGELSRVMLAIKTLAATSRHGFNPAFERPASAEAPGLIFDEVDAGIGGRVADVVGGKLRALGSAFQVLCITHVPQIAAYADTHFHIEKRVEKGRTHTSVTRLDDAGRVGELGRMLGGTSVTESVRASAREMLEHRRAAATRSPAKGESERRKRR